MYSKLGGGNLALFYAHPLMKLHRFDVKATD
ncbi:MAG: hypothetical protein ACJAX2_002480 [Celeribacter sp.]|jgi:hypothetical protein